jgi:hypothetical protein
VSRWFLAVAFGILATTASAQSFFNTARTDGFGSPSIVMGVTVTSLNQELGSDYTQFTFRGSVGVGRKTDVFGSLDGVRGSDYLKPNFLAWTLGLKHQFIRTGVVDVGALLRFRGNNTNSLRFEGSLMDIAGIVSLQISPVHPYYALLFSRPFSFDLTNSFQKTSVIGAEVPLGDIPRIFGEVTLGDRRSFGAALKLAF